MAVPNADDGQHAGQLRQDDDDFRERDQGRFFGVHGRCRLIAEWRYGDRISQIHRRYQRQLLQ
jgi:hypothetical protein